jgi:hypothetical protein
MKLEDLRNNCFLEIIEFLTFSEIASLRVICKFFQKLISNNYQFIQNLLSSRYLIENSENLRNWDEISEKIKKGLDSNTIEYFYPYYTNGGTYHNYSAYFIQNILNGRVYCTTEKNNILVKYGFTRSEPMPETDPLDHKISDTEFCIKSIEDSMDIDWKNISFIHSVKISIPIHGFTCPVSTLMVFSSIEKEDLGMIKLFYNTFDVDQVVHIANSLNLNPIVDSSDSRTKVTFDRRELGLAPLMWVKVKSVYTRQEHYFSEKLQKSRFARYFYLLLIEAENLGSDFNIDCGEVIPVFKLIRIKN